MTGNSVSDVDFAVCGGICSAVGEFYAGFVDVYCVGVVNSVIECDSAVVSGVEVCYICALAGVVAAVGEPSVGIITCSEVAFELGNPVVCDNIEGSDVIDTTGAPF